jgi:hypothetical protein
VDNVIKVDFRGETENNGYSIKDGNLIGVLNKTIDMELIETGDNLFEIFSDYGGLSRQEMAEWLWMAAHMLDSEERYKFESYVGLNYVEHG